MPSETSSRAVTCDAEVTSIALPVAARADRQQIDQDQERNRRRIAARRPELSNELGSPGALTSGAELFILNDSVTLPANLSDLDILAKPVGQIAKRCFDVVCAGILIAALASFMLALIWLVRRDGSPAFYRHKRVGAGGHPFYCLKFRSMVTNADGILADLLLRDPDAAAEWEATQKLRKDPRITPVGRFLRKTSLDELPQLLNVLRGEMSLVGPRPIVGAETRFYGDYIKHYYATRPGITGLWQVSGRSDTTYERRVELDVSYVRNWTFWQDIIILLKTLPVVLLRSGAV